MRFFLLIALLFFSLAAMADTAVVVDNVRANLRSGKSENYRVIGVLTPSSRVEVLKVEGEYAQVKNDEGLTGWVASRLLKMDQPAAAEAKPAAADSCTTELDAAKQRIQEAETQAAQAQAELEKQKAQQPGGNRKLAWLGLIGLVVGIAIGMLLREHHYRKRLQGLRV